MVPITSQRPLHSLQIEKLDSHQPFNQQQLLSFQLYIALATVRLGFSATFVTHTVRIIPVPFHRPNCSLGIGSDLRQLSGAASGTFPWSFLKHTSIIN
jgi:hypothetical protein